MISVFISLVALLSVNFIDLGLSVKWADTNAGADSPSQPGAYFTWDEISAYSVPTFEEMSELMEECQWHMETVDGRKGYRVTAENGNSIFLPCCGYKGGGDKVISDNMWGYYWSATVSEFGQGERMGMALSASGGYRWYSGPHDMRFPIREVSR